MKTNFISAINRHAPIITKRVKGKHCPWLTTNIKSHMNERDKVLRKARKTKKDSDWSMYKRLKNRCNNLIKQAKSKYHNDLLIENKNNPNKFWKTVKSIFPGEKGIKHSLFRISNDTEKNVICK